MVLNDHSLDLEEVEGLIRSGGKSGVGSGTGASSRRTANSSYCDQVMDRLFEPKNRKRWMTMAFLTFLFLLIVAANTGTSATGSESKIVKQGASNNQVIDFIDPNSPTAAPDNNDRQQQIVITEPNKEPQVMEHAPDANKDTTTTEPQIITIDPPKAEETPATDAPKPEEPAATDAPKPEEPAATEPPKPLPAANSKIPLIEPDKESGPIPVDKKAELAAKWGRWGFWDGDVDMRPKEDYIDKYPSKDVPGDDFPQNSWQTDAVFVNHYLNDADKLIDRAMESIFTEYGHGKPLPPEEMAARMKMFHWEKIDLSEATQPPPEFRKRGARDIGGWTSKRSFDGLVRRLLHAMITRDTFTVLLAGHSAAQGQGNHFRQSYAMQFHRVMKPIFERLGVKLITHNMAQGGLGTLQGGMGAGGIYGKEIDLFLWDSGMTEGGAPHHVDLVIRQVLMSGNRVPIIWGAPFDLLKLYHEEGDADVGEWGTGYAGLPETTSEEQALTLPWAARNMKCTSERQDLCNENRYSSTCWLNRTTDDIKPNTGQRPRPKGQVKWHPGWRPHQLMGRVLAFSVLEGLEVAVNTWMEGTMTGQPLDDDYWHVTEYYENIRTKIRNLNQTAGKCPDIANEGQLPARMCNTPMQGKTQYTPRVDYENSALTSIIKPSAASGYVPANGNKQPALYEGPDAHNPAYDIPEGSVDVLSIVMGRRRLSEETTPWYNRLLSNMAQPWMTQPRRRLDEAIVPGDGWDVALEIQGDCDGTYDSVCAHSPDEECFLMGHPDGRGAVVGCEWSGWLVMTLKDLKAGIIVVKLQTWHWDKENPRTARWNSVNDGKRRLGESLLVEDEEGDDEMYYMGDLAYPVIQEMPQQHDSTTTQRRLKMRSYETPPLPDTFAFDYAINGKITTLNNTEFMAEKKNLQRVVETLTILDDPDFIKDAAQDVEVAFRLRGVGRSIVFGVSHIYWA